jgi:hypothetical protein
MPLNQLRLQDLGEEESESTQPHPIQLLQPTVVEVVEDLSQRKPLILKRKNLIWLIAIKKLMIN